MCMCVATSTCGWSFCDSVCLHMCPAYLFTVRCHAAPWKNGMRFLEGMLSLGTVYKWMSSFFPFLWQVWDSRKIFPILWSRKLLRSQAGLLPLESSSLVLSPPFFLEAQCAVWFPFALLVWGLCPSLPTPTWGPASEGE